MEKLMTINLKEQDHLEEVISLISKTVKGDRELIYHILFNGLSAFTSKPNHLMIMERSSEGKTYPVLQISQHFPEENVITLGSVTPQIFKYEIGLPVDKNYEPIQERLDHLDKQISLAKENKNKSDGQGLSVKELEIQKRELLSEVRYLVDMRNKWIIFKEPPDSRLLEVLYSTLSSDEEFNEHRFVNKEKGKNQSFKVVLRGTPAILICTAKDESKNNRWEETFTRFNIISPVSNSQKYREGMRLISKSFGLPKELYEEQVINEEEKKRISSLIQELIEQVSDLDGEVFNPFMDELDKQFPQESGFRWRQYQRFLGTLNLHCLCYSRNRPKCVMKEKKVPFVTKADVRWAFSTIKEQNDLPPNKLNWFKDTFVPAWKNSAKQIIFNGEEIIERKCIIGQDLRLFIKEKTSANVSTKQIRENYLDILFEHGLIEKENDPRNRTREVYWPVEGYDEKSESSLISFSSLNESCVNSFIEKYLKQRFSFELHGKILTQEEVIQYILSDQNVI